MANPANSTSSQAQVTRADTSNIKSGSPGNIDTTDGYEDTNRLKRAADSTDRSEKRKEKRKV